MANTWLTEQPLRILVIGSTYPRNEDDYAVPWMREAHNQLARRGHDITVLAPSFEGLADHTIDGIPVKRFRYAPRRWECLTHEQGAPNKLKNPFEQLLGIPYMSSGIRAATKLARELPFDIVHVHWPFPHGPIGRAAARVSGAPLVMMSHGAEFHLAKRKKWIRPLLSRALRSADLRLANSTDTAARVKALSGKDAVVLPYGSTVTPKSLDVPENPRPRILFTGRLIQRKGVEYLLRALPLVLRQHQVDLIITGDGDQREALEQLTQQLDISGHVQFLGFVSNEQLNEEYARCDMWVNPSIIDDRGDTEGLGVGSIEAYAHSKPVIASDVGGIPDTVIHEKTGLLVPQKDEEALAKAIIRLIESPAAAKRFGRGGLEFAQERFDWQRITDRLEEEYYRLMDSSGFGEELQELDRDLHVHELAPMNH